MRDSRQLEYPSLGPTEGRAYKETPQGATRKPSPQAPAEAPAGQLADAKPTQTEDAGPGATLIPIARLDGAIDETPVPGVFVFAIKFEAPQCIPPPPAGAAPGRFLLSRNASTTRPIDI
jgi:hypothetical protein